MDMPGARLIRVVDGDNSEVAGTPALGRWREALDLRAEGRGAGALRGGGPDAV